MDIKLYPFDLKIFCFWIRNSSIQCVCKNSEKFIWKCFSQFVFVFECEYESMFVSHRILKQIKSIHENVINFLKKKNK